MERIQETIQDFINQKVQEEGYSGALIGLSGGIDSSFRGEIVASLLNAGGKEVLLEKGQKFAQMIIQEFEHCDIEEVKELSETVRGHGREGSTGMR